MFHYGNESYATAATRAAEYGRQKFTSLLTEGRARSGAVLARVIDEQPQDALIPASRSRVDLSGDKPVLLSGDTRVGVMHRNAFRQLAGRAGIPLAYAEKLVAREEPWARELAEQNFAELLSHTNGTKFLTRSVGGEVRGVLSDSYKRIHTPTVMESFMAAATAHGAVPIDAVGSDLRVAFRFAIDSIFEPLKNEVMVYGVELRTSDYGVGSLSVTFFVMRVVCTNLMTGSDALRRVHLGARLTDEAIQYSDKTMELDAAAVCSAMNDVVGHLLGTEHIRKVNEGLAAAASDKLSMGNATNLLREYLGKKDAEEAVKVYAEDRDLINLPAEETRWRLSNVLSLLAGQTSDGDRKMDLQDAAGKVLGRHLPAAFA